MARVRYWLSAEAVPNLVLAGVVEVGQANVLGMIELYVRMAATRTIAMSPYQGMWYVSVLKAEKMAAFTALKMLLGP